MTKDDLAKLNEYETRIIKWCLASGAISEYLGKPDAAAQNKWPNRKPWPLTEEEGEHWRALSIALKEEAEKLDDTPQHLLPFRLTGNWENFKFIK